jgi:hypothetical protein
VMAGGTLQHLHRFLQCIKCIMHEFTPSEMWLVQQFQKLSLDNVQNVKIL